MPITGPGLKSGAGDSSGVSWVGRGFKDVSHYWLLPRMPNQQGTGSEDAQQPVLGAGTLQASQAELPAAMSNVSPLDGCI